MIERNKKAPTHSSWQKQAPFPHWILISPTLLQKNTYINWLFLTSFHRDTHLLCDVPPELCQSTKRPSDAHMALRDSLLILVKSLSLHPLTLSLSHYPLKLLEQLKERNKNVESVWLCQDVWVPKGQAMNANEEKVEKEEWEREARLKPGATRSKTFDRVDINEHSLVLDIQFDWRVL